MKKFIAGLVLSILVGSILAIITITCSWYEFLVALCASAIIIGLVGLFVWCLITLLDD